MKFTIKTDKRNRVARKREKGKEKTKGRVGRPTLQLHVRNLVRTIGCRFSAVADDKVNIGVLVFVFIVAGAVPVLVPRFEVHGQRTNRRNVAVALAVAVVLVLVLVVVVFERIKLTLPTHIRVIQKV